jgi:hypothetical protein
MRCHQLNEGDYEVVDPRPDSIVESLRAFGYSLPNAVADIVDNSITAGASRVDIHMTWDGPKSWVKISDNGCGMLEPDLVEAMRLGTKGPLESRDLKDLGRFGLGLKTASFSQCRCLSVRTKAKRGREFARCWDLDLIIKERKWSLLKGPRDAESDRILGHLDSENGTLVLWQSLDRVVGREQVSDRKALERFSRRIGQVSEYLGCVFHRFIAAKLLSISINDGPIEPWDPFLKSHPCTQALPVEKFGSQAKEVVIQPFVLPHQSKLEPDGFASAAGQRGWSGQQGFYIYRNKRLIVDGSWLGYFQQEEHLKLARIQIDISNASDLDWKIDVRKAQAHPPDSIREEVKRIASATRKVASEVYRHRGTRLRPEGDSSSPQVYVWDTIKKRDKVSYKINREHPLIRQLIDSPDARTAFAVLSLVEETIPIPFIIGNFSSNIDQQGVPFEEADTSILREQLRIVVSVLREEGLSDDEVRRELLLIEPFQHYPELIASVSFDDVGSSRETRNGDL